MNKTQIFKNYSDFLSREDKEVNGVDQNFADNFPDYKKQNKTNKGCWNCSDCSGCYRCSRCSGCSGCSDCSGCYRCSRCSGCSGCYRCSDCSGCSGCSRCSDLKNASPVQSSEINPDAGFKVPVIENIHEKILEAVSKDNALEMTTWHTCDTTHCRGGWVIHLAGKPGYELANKTGDTLFAAMQIYHKSCPEIPVSPVRFFETNDVAMADIKRCAKEEKELKATK